MSNSTEDLQKRYRQVQAPPFLATRIVAGLPANARERRWLPAFAALAAVAAVITLVPRYLGQDNLSSGAVSPVSLASLSRMTPDKAPLASPSLTRLKTVKSPPLPARPSLLPAEEPQSRLPETTTESKEQTNA